MRVVHASALTAAVLVLASVASAQGLGDAAAREKEKRKAAPAKPAKVYTEGDIGPSMAPVSATPDLPPADAPAGGDQPAAEGQPPAEGQGAEGQAAEGQAAPEGGAAAAAAASEEEAKARAQEAWRKRLDAARKEEAVYKDVIAKLQLELDDISGGLYNPGRASKIAFQEENKQKLAEVQARIAALEEEGRRNRYR